MKKITDMLVCGVDSDSPSLVLEETRSTHLAISICLMVL